MASAKRISVKPVKIAATYRAVHDAWRAGAVKDFRYGTRSETDATLEWTVDGAVYAQKDHAGVLAHVARALTACGIVRVSQTGESWVGYPVLEVEFSNGTIVRDAYTGARTVAEVQA